MWGSRDILAKRGTESKLSVHQGGLYYHGCRGLILLDVVLYVVTKMAEGLPVTQMQQ